jgi:multimeric flavodoxin WrbA/putative sterol carrier protein
MKVLALNSSARPTDQSKTELVLTHLVKGMREAGAEVEVVNLRQKKINFCIGCYSCWTKTPGVCVHKDDMALELFPKWLEADIAVYATPLYHFTVNAQMKTFIERTLPVLMPYLKRKDVKEGTTHPLRGKHPAAVFVSVAGFPDISVFDALAYLVKALTSRGNNLLGEIYIAGAEALAYHWKRDEILEAVEQAGKEIVTQKAVSPETMSVITQQFVDPDQMAAVANVNWQAMIDEGMTPAEATRKGLAPRPESVESFMAILSMGFNPQKAKGKKGILQFDFTGDKPGSCYFNIDEKSCIPHMGRPEKADCTVTSPLEVWADIIQGKAEGAKMFMEGKYTTQGNFSLMMVFGKS